jgi:tRNA 2-selenouridine synthase
VIGGYTGSSKTYLLHELEKRGEQIIDLEQLAGHKGSAFGNLDMIEQPGQEQFENLLAQKLYENSSIGNNQPIWIEGESQRMGLLNIPQSFFKTLRNAPLIFLDIPFSVRLKQIVKDYGSYDKEKIINGIVRIKKRLGGLETKNAINFLLEDDIENCFDYLLKYYDRLYLKSTFLPTETERKIIKIESGTTDVKSNFKKIMEHARS